MDIYLTVEIKTRQGVFKRVNTNPYEILVVNDTWEPPAGVLLYPDNRAKKMRVWALDSATGDYRLVKTFDLSASKTSNYAFALVESVDLSSFETEEILVLVGFNDKNEVYGNRVKASETNQPFVFKADKTYYPGKNTEDEVVTFAVNSLPVSSGQFGEYPIFIMCKESIWALEQSPDPLIAFGRVSAYSLTHGVNNRKTCINVDRSVAFLFGSRLYLLDVGIKEIGKPIEDILTGNEILAYYNNDGDREIWVVGVDRILAYNTEYGRWFLIERGIKSFAKQGNVLTSIDGDGFFYNEHNLSTQDVPVSVSFQPIHYGQPDALKRVFNVILRAAMKTLSRFAVIFETSAREFSTTQGYLALRHPSDFSYRVDISGVMTPGSREYIQGLDTDFELRYSGKRRRGVTTPQIQPPSLSDTGLNVSAVGVGGFTVYQSGETETADQTKPTISDSQLSVSSVTENGFIVDFIKATDNRSSQSDLEYRLYTSTFDNLGSVSDIESNGTPVDFGVDISSLGVSGLTSGERKYFNVTVTDQAGNKAAYTTGTQVSADLTIDSILIEEMA